MEYSMIEGRSIEHLLAVLNVQVGEGWRMVGNPVYDPRNRAEGGLGTWFAVVAKDPDREAASKAIQEYQAMMQSMEHDRAELLASLETLRAKLAELDDRDAANPGH